MAGTRQTRPERVNPDGPEDGRRLLDRPVTAAEQEEWARELAGEKVEEHVRGQAVVVFRLASEWLALPAVSVRRIVDARPCHRVPYRTDSVMLGLVNVDGELLPCVAATALMGLEVNPEGGPPPRLAVVGRTPDSRFAFPVNELLGVRRLAESEWLPPPATLSRAPSAYVDRVAVIEGRQVGRLAEDRFVAALIRSLKR